MCEFSPLKDTYSVSKYDVWAPLRLIAAITVGSERRALPGGHFSLSSVVMEGIHPANEGTGLVSSSRKGREMHLTVRKRFLIPWRTWRSVSWVLPAPEIQ